MEIKTDFKKSDYMEYKKQIETSIKVNTMAIQSDTALLEWLDKKIREYDKKEYDKWETQTTSKEEKKNTK